MARILVIDDELAVVSAVGRMAEHAGHEVRGATDVEAGLKLLRGVDLAIIDIYMPGLGGLETIPLLRKRHPTLRIIAMSGAQGTRDGDITARALALGATYFLAKPFDADQLLAVIGALLPDRSSP